MKIVKKEKSNDHYIDLLVQADRAAGRKEAIRLIHKADKARIDAEEEKRNFV